MKRRPILGSAIAAAALAVSMGGIAYADGYSAPKAASVAPDTWAGFYAGASVGGAWTTLQNQWPVTDHFFVQGTSFDVSTANVVEGVHVGWQHQWGGIVAGVEFAGSFYNDMDDRTSSFIRCTNGAPCGIENRVEWSFQAVGRLGVAVGHVLPYVKAGWAVIDVNTLEVECCAPVGTNVFNNPKFFSRDDKLQSGWVLGGGLEWALMKNVILGVDYQHIFVNDGTHGSPCVGADSLVCTTAPFNGNVRVTGDLDQVTARLSFKFDRETTAAKPLK